jgi:hypothetical protein
MVEKLASGSKSVAGIPNKGLIDLLKYFFNPPTEGLSKMKHPQLVDAAKVIASVSTDLRHKGC